jgi:GntR family transcriptional regulator, transcriptional repressor for pyruvate dehydrogenase complex
MSSPATARDLLLSPVEPAGAVEQVVRRIGEAIGAGVLGPGERLPGQVELAATLGVARMTLRQALAILEDASLIEVRRGRTGGAFVAADPPPPALDPPTAEQLRRLTDWRRAVSGEAAALAAERRASAEVTALREAMVAVQDAAADAGAYRRADARFHVLVAELARSPRLLAAEANLQVELGEVLALTPGPAGARRASQAGHEPIVAAIAAGRADPARAATVRHVEATHDWVVGLARGLSGRPAARRRAPR